ncbi:MAG: hypothetical protein NW220_08955 [Leptolyngbyaceae cyanobacterium bins.349]|nr:hypothetical protein [Leptolyngbyaceae cyanobacterium bins.349]
MSIERQLSPTTRYHICKLLRQTLDCESASLLAFKAQLAANNCAQLNTALQDTYPDPSEWFRVMLQLDNLVYLYTTLHPEMTSGLDHTAQLAGIRQQIYQLLGFRAS